MRRAARTDKNHGEIRNTLRRLGWTILDVSSCGGLCDLLAKRGASGVRLIEIKAGPKSKLTESQQKLIAEGWPIVILRTIQDAADLR